MDGHRARAIGRSPGRQTNEALRTPASTAELMTRGQNGRNSHGMVDARRAPFGELVASSWPRRKAFAAGGRDTEPADIAAGCGRPAAPNEPSGRTSTSHGDHGRGDVAAARCDMPQLHLKGTPRLNPQRLPARRLAALVAVAPRGRRTVQVMTRAVITRSRTSRAITSIAASCRLTSARWSTANRRDCQEVKCAS